MAETNEIAAAFRAIWERSGLSMDAFAKAMGFKGASSVQRYLTPGQFDKPLLPMEIARKAADVLVDKGRPPITREEIMVLAGYPGTGHAEAPGALREHPAEFERANIALPGFSTIKDVPVYGGASGGTRGEFIMSEDKVDTAWRPAHFVNARNLYAVFVRNDSMSPAYESGQCVLVNPDRPPKPGDYVVVQLRATNGDLEALFKRLKKLTADGVVLEQLNPPKELRFKKAEIVKVDRVYTWNEVLGV